MTPRETWSACKGYNDKVTREFQTSWEQTRWLGAVVLNPHSKKDIKPKDLTIFPWEEEGTGPIEEEVEKLKEYRKWRQQ